MNLADASNQFSLRHYIWSKAEWEKEINESFPHLRMFKTGHAWDIYQFMQKLNNVECQIDEGHWTSFDVKCGGWMLTTQFNFGRQQSVLGYWHNVCSQRKAPHPAMSEVMYPVAFLCRCVRWPCSGQWEYLTEEDVELACNETFKYCYRFFEAAPSLLKDLDVEGISEN